MTFVVFRSMVFIMKPFPSSGELEMLFLLSLLLSGLLFASGVPLLWAESIFAKNSSSFTPSQSVQSLVKRIHIMDSATFLVHFRDALTSMEEDRGLALIVCFKNVGDRAGVVKFVVADTSIQSGSSSLGVSAVRALSVTSEWLFDSLERQGEAVTDKL